MFTQELELVHESVEESGAYSSVMEAEVTPTRISYRSNNA